MLVYRMKFGRQPEWTMMDELDSALISALQADGRRSNRELASQLGLAPSTTLERVRSLRSRGVLTGVHATVDLAAVGRPVQAMITVRLRPQSRTVMHGFRDFVAALPETMNVYITTGFEDLLVHVAVPSTQALQDFVLDSLTKRKEVADVRTAVVFEHVRNHVVVPGLKGH
jgi:DNA-binding Lrp family transcriptional regulator